MKFYYLMEKLITKEDKDLKIRLKTDHDVFDFDKLELESPIWLQYKINKPEFEWSRVDDLSNFFVVANNLCILFPQIFLMIKVYLTVPVTSAEAERS